MSRSVVPQQFFDVTVVREDCLKRCAIGTSGLGTGESGQSSDLQTTACREHTSELNPKLGLHHADVLQRQGRVFGHGSLGIETFFAIATLQSTHPVADRLSIGRCSSIRMSTRYGLLKSMPVLISNSNFSLYPWRRWYSPPRRTSLP
jgi:hypothetical protein